jgi:hypothetical protein
MILSFYPGLRSLGVRLGLGLGGRRRVPWLRDDGVHQLRDARLDGLIGRELRLGVELELALGPVEGVDDGVVAGLAVALGVKKVPEQEVQGRGLPIPVADDKRTGGPLALSGFQ